MVAPYLFVEGTDSDYINQILDYTENADHDDAPDSAACICRIKNFNMQVFNEPKVSKRQGSYYYVFDGDHSIAAHKIRFGKDTPIRCKVYYGLTREEEMRLFVAQNGISSNPTRIEKLQALANYEDPKVTEMISTAREIGINVEFRGSQGQNKILAVDTAYWVYEILEQYNKKKRSGKITLPTT